MVYDDWKSCDFEYIGYRCEYGCDFLQQPNHNQGDGRCSSPLDESG
jgi:hypothetical protein